MKCPCGCPLPVKRGRKYATKQCWRVLKPPAPYTRQCRTCPAKLTGKDRARGCRRCEACRAKVRQTYPNRLTNVETQNPNTINLKAPKPAPRADSWWTRPNLSREEFSQLSKQVVSIDTGIRFASGANGEAW